MSLSQDEFVMRAMLNPPYRPRGILFGYAGDGAFVFRCWKDIWTAVSTTGHPLAEHASRVISARRFVQPGLFQRIRISFDATPPIVETVYPRWFGWGIVIGFGLAFWAGVLSVTCRGGS